jgi:hypothetical protein
MSSPGELYVKGVRKKLHHYYAAWLPNEELSLGDVGILDKGIFFRRKKSLALLGISFTVRKDPHPTPFDLQSDKGVQITSKAAYQSTVQTPNIPVEKAGVAVDFSAKEAFVVKAPETYEPTIEDIDTVQTQIVDLYKKRKWRRQWVVIVKIVNAPIATILVSKSSQGKIELAAEGQFPAGSTVQLGQANLQFSVSFSSGDILALRNAQDVSPFFQLAGLKLKQELFREGVPEPELFKVGTSLGNPMDSITPAMVRENETLASSLYLGLIDEPVVEAEEE